MTTKVKFYIEPKINTVMAFFPENDYYHYKSNTKTCYAHIGQHSSCSKGYLRACKLADPTSEDVQQLISELKSVGYDDLLIIDSRRKK